LTSVNFVERINKHEITANALALRGLVCVNVNNYLAYIIDICSWNGDAGFPISHGNPMGTGPKRNWYTRMG